MAKKNWLIPVSVVIQTLMTQGYNAAKARTGEFNPETSGARFSSALSLAKDLGANKITVDAVIRDYISRSKKTTWITSTLELPAPALMVQFARLGASRSTVNLLAKEFARRGILWGLLEALKILRRGPEETEIRMLAKDYIKGATESRATEEKIVELAKGVSRALEKEISEKISHRRHRLALYCD
ncbi:MAG: hypothetical protein HYW90_02495 [Candidatus Sungbacteria bacterium]|nr:hypothetical protein [Candidatus Sungbacteria bacterium]